VGDSVPAASLTALAREVLGNGWNDFLERGSADLAVAVRGVRCRVNILRSARGVGFAIRLLGSSQVTLQRLNLHPDLKRLVQGRHGLILVSGPTGSGKTTTLAALIQEINLSEARHIITLENPVEYTIAPRQSFVRQREVGRDTPTFEQALIDALREDPDVLVVGEMREPAVMRLTLNAAETGHLVLATVHSSTAPEALQRIVSSFPAEIQSAVCGQIADCLVGVVAQRLHVREDVGVRVPACEILMASTPVKALVRQGQFFKLDSAIETGAADGSWSWARYAEWLARKTDWVLPKFDEEVGDAEVAPVALPSLPRAVPTPTAAAKSAPRRPVPKPKAAEPAVTEDGVLVIDEGDDPAAVLRQLTKDDD
jgi:twitching motility protein PilT